MNRILKGFLMLTVFCIGGYIVAEWRMKIEVQRFLERKIPNHIEFSYDALNINLIYGDLAFDKVKVISLGRQTSSCEIRVQADLLSVEGFSYWKFFQKDAIYLKKLILSEPHLNFKTCPKDTTDNVTASKPINLLKPIFIKELIFNAGQVEIRDPDDEVEPLTVKTIQLSLNDVETNPEIINAYVPFKFSEYLVTVKELTTPLGAYERVKMGVLELDPQNIRVKDISLITKHSKQALSGLIATERDHIDLRIPNIDIDHHSYAIEADTLHVFYEKLALTSAVLEIYRDKAVPENYDTRRLYSEMLRELPFKLKIDIVSIAEATIRYEEDAPNNVEAGVLNFENLNSTITNFSNLASEKENVQIRLNADLMGTGSLLLDWEFKVQNVNEAFVISGELSNFNTDKLNDFLVPNVRTKTTGTIDQLYFTISGDKYVASGDIKMRYQDFKLQVLNKDRINVNKIVSFIGNLFVSDGSKADANGFRYGEISVERPKNKSFFNYLWVGVEDGLIDVLTGNGKKED